MSQWYLHATIRFFVRYKMRIDGVLVVKCPKLTYTFISNNLSSQDHAFYHDYLVIWGVVNFHIADLG